MFLKGSGNELFRSFNEMDAIRFEGETLLNLEGIDNQSPVITEILANCDECAIADFPVAMSHEIR